MSPEESTATPGCSIGRQWPDRCRPGLPPPATVVMIPLATLRMRLLYVSAMYRLPEPSTASANGTASIEGSKSSTLLAGPPSPEYPGRKLPQRA